MCRARRMETHPSLYLDMSFTNRSNKAATLFHAPARHTWAWRIVHKVGVPFCVGAWDTGLRPTTRQRSTAQRMHMHSAIQAIMPTP